jgi:hypothetical protein
MSDRQFKWREVGKTATRLNSMLAAKKELPSRFAPSRDRSDSVDKLFNNSRSRLHSSMDIAVLNSSREDSPHPLQHPPDKREESTERKTSVLKTNTLPTLLLGERQSTLLQESPSLLRSSQLVADIKKEFWAFRQNVLQELERQKEMVQRLLKEIVLTLEVELERLGRLSDDHRSPPAVQPRTIVEWKNTLTLTASTPPSRSPPSKPDLFPPAKADSSCPSLEPSLYPPKKTADPAELFTAIETLKREFLEMDCILEDRWEGKGQAKSAVSLTKRK